MLLALPLAANPVNPPLSFTGGFGEPNCGQCHTGTTVTAGSNVMILGTPAIYSPGSTIPIQVQITDSASNWGFELSARFTSGAQAGSFTPNNTVSVRTGSWKGFPVQYAAQGAAAVQNGTNYVFSVNWTSPPEVLGWGVITTTPGLMRSGQSWMPLGLPLRTRKTMVDVDRKSVV